jgi:signal transduction histidine kinase
VLGITVSAYSVRAAAQDRRDSLSYMTGVVAAAIMPVVADQDPARIEAQLESIVGLPEGYEIECIRLLDTGGRVLAESEPRCTCDEVEPAPGLLSTFTEPQVVEQPIVVDGLTIAVASVQFKPIGLGAALWRPLRVTAAIVFVAVVISSLWGTWVTMRTVVEPVEGLRDGAEDIAEGRRDLDLWSDRRDEIGQLARSLDDMMEQLEDKEGQLLDSYHSLEEALAAQERLGQQLQRTIKVRSDFVAVASHELRSPLAVIQLYAELMASGELGELDERIQDAVRAIASAAARLGSIMTNLMDVALLERGLMPLEFSDVRLDVVLRSATEDARALARAREVTVAIDEDVPEVVVRADRLRVRQVLDNLLSNAVKYASDAALVEVSLCVDGDDAVVRVRDHGRGIPQDRRHVLFEPFGRVESGDDAENGGIGLGLAISARIAEAHGGSLDLDPEVTGPGSAFRLRLPLHPTAEAAHVRIVPDG